VLRLPEFTYLSYRLSLFSRHTKSMVTSLVSESSTASALRAGYSSVQAGKILPLHIIFHTHSRCCYCIFCDSSLSKLVLICPTVCLLLCLSICPLKSLEQILICMRNWSTHSCAPTFSAVITMDSKKSFHPFVHSRMHVR